MNWYQNQNFHLNNFQLEFIKNGATASFFMNEYFLKSILYFN